ncbi:hypothetical protein OH768_51415 [Streptomyces sp. NBC_01622]|uniref:hypothetical protein n=1 Tax=Streptomyces sp. NBC_01622 TaxID=2975903 RepID=UPI003863CAAB|nr:hypothetical protein OH768_51415 [Streptomyces sp. NBC_01622]
MPLRPDWEKAVTPVADWLYRCPEVDRDRIALVGWSLCGESVTRDEVDTVWREQVVPGLSAVDRFTLAKRAELFGPGFHADAPAGRPPMDVWGLRETSQRQPSSGATWVRMLSSTWAL